MDAYGATPTLDKSKLKPGQQPQVAFQDIADAYTKLHPNVKIQWVELPQSVGRLQWLQARMLAKDAPDIFGMNYDDAWQNLGKGWFMPWDDYIKNPTPYVQGSKAWSEEFDQSMWNTVRAPDGKHYTISPTGVGVLHMYNKSIFQEAGVGAPNDWTQFLSIQDKILSKGYIPNGVSLDQSICCSQHWIDQLILGQLLYDKYQKWDDNKNGFLDPDEIIRHFENGDFPGNWDLLQTEFELMKQMVKYWPKGYEGHIDYRQLFRQKKVSFYLAGSWEIGTYARDPLDFEYDFFQFPLITKENTPLASGTRVRIIGPWGPVQWEVPGYLPGQDAEKLNLILDWLQFASTPENNGKLAQESGSIPYVKDAPMPAKMKPFLDDSVPRIVIQGMGATISSEYANGLNKLLQQYLPGRITTDSFMTQMKALMKQEIDKLKEKYKTQ